MRNARQADHDRCRSVTVPRRMSPKVKRRFHAIIRRTGIKPKRALEVGGLMGKDSLLRFPELAGAERYCLNLVDLPSEDGITAVKGNANDMRQFQDDWFDLVVCCSTLEHDKRFWLSVAEMKRVLAPGGLLIIGVPGYVKDEERDQGRSTLTYRVHLRAMMTPPRIIGHGRKPRRRRPAPRRRSLRARAVRRARALSSRVRPL